MFDLMLTQTRWRLWMAALILNLAHPLAHAQQQQQGVCASVKIEIIQELTLERIGFEATLEITNNDGDDPITDFFADLTFEDPLADPAEGLSDVSNLFFVRAPTLEGITDVNGAGVIGATKKAVMRWFIIPKITAGGTSPDGVRYRVGARLSGKFQGEDLPPEVLRVFPDTITVKPEPQLEITYFQPRDVQGDDPFTEQVESPIPFTLGVIIKNSGHGLAKSVKINSQQPRIVENRRNLLLVAQLLGTRVMDSPLKQADLLVNLGDIQPGTAKKGAWDMITSLSGEFVEFKASYTHASELGGEETSVIKSLEAHFIAHEVINDQPGRDSIKDFLADTDRDAGQIPDALYESEGNVLPVNHLTTAAIEGSGMTHEITVTADREGWGYVRLNDPGQARLKIARVLRSDGKLLNSNNVWTNVRYEKGTNNRLAYLNLLDLVELGPYSYTLTYEAAGIDSAPPVTTLHFAGAATQVANRYFITPDTQMYFLSEDESPVAIYYRITNSAFIPALPFRVRDPGEYPVDFYAIDSSGNREENQSVILIVGDALPELADLTVSSDPLFAGGGALSVRPGEAEVRFRAAANPLRMNALIEVFRGISSWAQVRGAPSSPTAARTAQLEVSGVHVDYYKYKLNGGGWSEERPVSELISLSGLPDGDHQVRVLGRSIHGQYPDEARAVLLAWRVSASAPATRISGTPFTPSRQRTATLSISGAGVTDYRWTLNDSFYRAEQPISVPLALSALTGTSQVVSVLGKIAGTFQPTNNPTTVAWKIDPNYGSDLTGLALVRSLTIDDVGATEHVFRWDGTDDSGVVMPPGWYTVRIRLTDELGRDWAQTALLKIDDATTRLATVADAARGPKNPYARGQWAVWQDQSEGVWAIYGRRLGGEETAKISTSPLNEENPATDGRYAVWQGRRPNGNWDIFYKDLELGGDVAALTDSSATDEVKPVVEWPWVVYQSRPAGNTNAAWQLHTYNLSTRLVNVVWPGALEQLDPALEAGRVVWQDHRDVGYGEIYFKDLETGEQRRITENSFGQYFPAIHGQWIVWQDNRHGQVDLYGFDLLRNRELRITDTAENEARPKLDGPWVICEEDSLGVEGANLRLIHLPSLRRMELTRTATLKRRPSFWGESILWEETVGSARTIMRAEMPVVQAVFENQNAVVVTDAMVQFQQDAHSLLRKWHEEAGVQEISFYRSLVPQVAKETARIENGQPSGANFDLEAGSFLWIRFDASRVLELGNSAPQGIDLAPGVNIISHAQFPSGYSAFNLLRQLGLDSARAVRMLDAGSGQWRVAEALDNKLIGQDFDIPKVGVLLIEMINGRNQWKPE